MSDDDTPALLPPDGELPNFIDPPSLDVAAIATFTICLTFTTLTLICRFFAQWRLFGKLTWADLFVAVAWACHVCFDAILLSALPYGLGRHQWDVTTKNYDTIEYYLYISFILYDPAILFAKLSILNQFLHIFSSSYRNRFWYAIISFCAINVLFYVPLTFGLMFSCTPREKIWKPSVPGHCVNQTALLTSSGPFNVISDFLIFILPVWAIWQLKIPLRKRFAVSAGFAFGLFGCICSAVRIVYSARLARSGDGTYVITQNQMWANAECTVGILIANSINLPRYIRCYWGGSTRGTDATETSPSYDLKKYLRRKQSRDAPGSSLEGDFEWDADTPLPQGEAFNRLTNHSKATNTMHSRLSEELDLRPEDRVKVAPWAALEQNMPTARLWINLEHGASASPADQQREPGPS